LIVNNKVESIQKQPHPCPVLVNNKENKSVGLNNSITFDGYKRIIILINNVYHPAVLHKAPLKGCVKISNTSMVQNITFSISRQGISILNNLAINICAGLFLLE
jgi:hypothetical protein